MIGMLLKIVAFLAFLHLQRRCLMDISIAHLLPTMDDFVTEWAQRRVLAIHVGVLLTAAIAASWPRFGPIAAVVLAVEFCALGLVLVGAARRYRFVSRRIEAALRDAAAQPSVTNPA